MFHVIQSSPTLRHAASAFLCHAVAGHVITPRMVQGAPYADVSRFPTGMAARAAALEAGVTQFDIVEPLVEYKARMAGEASYLAGEVCGPDQCEARCLDLYRMAEREPGRAFMIYATFVAGWLDMSDCLERHGFTLEQAA